jgi:ribosome-associated toxin RatA of RatAB toxin-antitoxin module
MKKLFILLPLIFALNASPVDSVLLNETADGYHIRGNFAVKSTIQNVWYVLNDYDNLKGIISSLESSNILSTNANEIIIKQRVNGKFLIFSKSMDLMLKVNGQPYQKIDFKEISGKVFKRYEGTWTLQQNGEFISVAYDLNVNRGSLAWPSLEKQLFVENSEKMLKEMKQEIQKRIIFKADLKGKPVPGIN